MNKVAIMQSNYIPWRGYFDMINMVDEFIIFDSVQYSKKTWRNRNYIKTLNGLELLSIPVKVKGKLNQSIYEVETTDNHWKRKHWKSISINYSKSKYFNDYKHIFENIYLNSNENNLSKINVIFIKEICKILNIKTKIKYDYEYNYKHTLGDVSSIIDLLKNAKAGIFLNGPTAKQYMTEKMFSPHNIDLIWMDYSDYAEYTQLFPPFEYNVSILDLIFNTGPDAHKYMKSFN